MSDTASDSAPLLPKDQAPFWAFGAGNMAGSMISCWLNNGLNPKDMLVIRPSGKPVAEGVKVVTSLPEDGSTPATLLLGVKPQMLPQIAPALAPYINGKNNPDFYSCRRRIGNFAAFLPESQKHCPCHAQSSGGVREGRCCPLR